MIIASKFKGKKIAVVGLGKTGVSSAKSLSAGGAKVFAWDDFENARNNLSKLNLSNVFIQKPESYDWDNIESLILSAGIPLTNPKPHGAANLAKSANCKIICDVEILYNQCPKANYIGITGTNGKSTTTSLLGHILKSVNINCDVGGNLGVPATDFKMLSEGDAYVIEMSSYQLDLIKETKFNISVFLNITPDHLDRHGDIDGYIAAKSHIFDQQGASDIAVIAIDDEYTKKIYHTLVSDNKIGNVVAVSGTTELSQGISVVNNEVIINGIDRYNLGSLKYLPGSHNAQNIAASFAACLSLNISINDIISAIKTFKGLPHRMQYVREFKGVTFINDSKATNAEASANALKTFSNIYWIAGGVAKDGGINALSGNFSNIKNAYLIGEAKDEFAKTLSDNDVCFNKYESLQEAFAEAYRDALAAGGVVLLSPACASFDQWPNFEARGNEFCKLSHDLV